MRSKVSTQSLDDSIESAVARFEELEEVPDGHALSVTSGEGPPEEQGSALFERLIQLAGSRA